MSILPTGDIAGNKQLDIDRLELNHVHDSDWNFQFDQLVLWKFYEDEFIPIMSIGLPYSKETNSISKKSKSITIAIGHIGWKIPIKINYKMFSETFTNYDVELVERAYLERIYTEKDPAKWVRIKKHILYNKDWIFQK